MAAVAVALVLGGVSWGSDRISWHGVREDGWEYIAVGAVKTIGNMPTIWLIGAFVVGGMSRRPVSGAAAATLTLAGAVVVYYALIVASGERAGVNLLPAALAWAGVAAVAGPVLGAAGGAWSAPHGRRRAVAAGVLGAVFVAMGFFIVARSFSTPIGILHICVGAILSLVLAGRGRDRLIGLGTTTTLGVLGGAATLLVFAAMRMFLRA